MAIGAGATFTLSAVDQTAAAFAKVNENLEKLSKSAEDSGKRVEKGMKVGFALFLGTEALGALRKFGAEMFNISNATNRIDAQRLQAMHDSVSKAGEAFRGMAATIGSKLAPIIQMVADWFVKLVGDGEGFKTQFSAIFAALVRAVGVFADAWRGIEVIWAGLKLAFAGFELAVLTGLQSIDHMIVDVANKMPGVHLQYAQTIDGMTKASRERVDGLKKDLTDILGKPLPSTAMASAIADMDKLEGVAVRVTKKTTKAVKEARDEQDKMFDDILDKAADAIEKQNQALQSTVDGLRKAGMTRSEILDQQHQKEQDDLQSANVRRLISDDEYNQLRLASEMRYMESKRQMDTESFLQQNQISGWAADALKASEEKGWKGKIGVAKVMMGQMATLMQSHSKTAFNIGKALAISQAVIDGIAATIGAYKAGARIGGPPVGAAFAAVAAATSAMQIQQIRAQQFNGGGAANVGASASMSVGQTGLPIQEAPSLPQAAGGQSGARNVVIQVGSDTGMVSLAWVKEKLLPTINEAVGDGARIMVA